MHYAKASSGGPYDEAGAMAGASQSDEFLARILERYERLQSECDLVVREGTDYRGLGADSSYKRPFRFAPYPTFQSWRATRRVSLVLTWAFTTSPMS